MNFDHLKPKLTTILSNNNHSVDDRLSAVCLLLKSDVPHYDWVGFYFSNSEQKMLSLGPYAGTPTAHTAIPFGKGICGQVALSNQTFVVPDIAAQDNYIACSISVKSEIVIPIFVDEVNIGQLDIDSNMLDPFDLSDERFLEDLCKNIASILKKETPKRFK